ncbi:hypothetical protein DFQ30_009492 [Apophysomyces sp. BC1015]|nr:hypothetical protein DFQ30_009492 [Apophysomyces sp. BC1015]
MATRQRNPVTASARSRRPLGHFSASVRETRLAGRARHIVRNADDVAVCPPSTHAPVEVAPDELDRALDRARGRDRPAGARWKNDSEPLFGEIGLREVASTLGEAGKTFPAFSPALALDKIAMARAGAAHRLVVRPSALHGAVAAGLTAIHTGTRIDRCGTPPHYLPMQTDRHTNRRVVVRTSDNFAATR